LIRSDTALSFADFEVRGAFAARLAETRFPDSRTLSAVPGPPLARMIWAELVPSTDCR